MWNLFWSHFSLFFRPIFWRIIRSNDSLPGLLRRISIAWAPDIFEYVRSDRSKKNVMLPDCHFYLLVSPKLDIFGFLYLAVMLAALSAHGLIAWWSSNTGRTDMIYRFSCPEVRKNITRKEKTVELFSLFDISQLDPRILEPDLVSLNKLSDLINRYRIIKSTVSTLQTKQPYLTLTSKLFNINLDQHTRWNLKSSSFLIIHNGKYWKSC